jgi:predicted Zn finger-like uncharacterized protein
MLTQCPNCQTIFRVTSEILRVAEGQVRCGRCQRQFDALERLIDEDDDANAEANRIRSDSRVTQDESADDYIGVDEPDTHEDITLEGRHIEISGTYRVSDRFGTGSEVQQETTEEWVEIDDLEAEEETSAAIAESGSDDDQRSEPEAGLVPQDAQIDDYERELLEDEDVRAHMAQATGTIVRSTGSPRFSRPRPPEHRDTPADEELFGLPRSRAKEPKIWRILAAPLVLLLAVQWVHSYRATLARHPTIGEPLLALYRTLGVTLTPDWDLHAYQIRQWGVISDPATPGTLKVRASITNLADFAQPYPLLKLVLEDRWGEQIRAREFEPAEYLDPNISPNRMLSPGQQTNATIAIVDPGPDAEGFRFDVCLHGTGGTVCAEEVRRR